MWTISSPNSRSLILTRLLLLLATGLTSACAAGQVGSVGDGDLGDGPVAKPTAPARARLIVAQKWAPRGGSIDVGVKLIIQKDWHVYWHSPRDGGFATKIEWDLPKGVTADPTEWPVPHRFVDPGDLIAYGYENEVVLPVRIHIDRNFEQPQVILNGTVSWLSCKDICIQGSAKLSARLPVLGRKLQADAIHELIAAQIAKYRTRVPVEETNSPLTVQETFDPKAQTWTVEWSVPSPSGEPPLPVHDVVIFPHDPFRGQLDEAKVEAWSKDGQNGGRVTFKVEVFSSEFDSKTLGVTIVPKDFAAHFEHPITKPKQPFKSKTGLRPFVVRHSKED